MEANSQLKSSDSCTARLSCVHGIVAVEDRHEIAQHSPCILVHSQGTSRRVVDFRTSMTAPAVGLKRVPHKRQRHVTHHMVPRAARTRQNNYNSNNNNTLISYSYYVLVQLLHRLDGKIKSNHLAPHFETSTITLQSVAYPKNYVALPHCTESSHPSIAGWCIFRSAVLLELWQNFCLSYKKLRRCRGAFRRGFGLRKNRRNVFFVRRCVVVSVARAAVFVRVEFTHHLVRAWLFCGDEFQKNALQKITELRHRWD